MSAANALGPTPVEASGRLKACLIILADAENENTKADEIQQSKVILGRI
jgi:hypothetical protein